MASIALGTSIVVSQGTPVKRRIGTAILIGDVVYKNLADSGRLAKAIATSVAAAVVDGIAVSGGSVADQEILVLTPGGLLTTTATLVVGEPYFLSHTVAGQICLASDLASTRSYTFIGFAVAATTLRVGILASGVLHA